MKSADVIVAGGGAIGLSIAFKVARGGATVVVVDPEPGSGASAVAAGMLAPVTEVHYGEEALLALNVASSRLYPQWIQELEEFSGMDAGYRQTSTLLVARDADDNAAIDDVFSFQRKLGLDVTRLRSTECRDLEPGLAPNIRGGALASGDHQIDPGALVAALGAACAKAGVEVIRRPVTQITTEGGSVRGVVTDDGNEIGAPQVVVAMGARSGDLRGMPDGTLPVRPVKGQLLLLRPISGPIPITRNIRGLDVYLVPRADGRLVLGATTEEKGWDQTVVAGAVHELLRDAYELVPGIAEMEFLGARVGFRPGTPDNAPLLGATGIPGLTAATGHFRNGILLTPITADALAELVLTGVTPETIAAFAPTRFRAPAVSPS